MKHTTSQDGHRIAYQATGKTDAHSPKIALIHSLAMDHTFWEPVAERLSSRAGIVAIDARGHGRSDKPPGPYDAPAMAQDLVAVLDTLAWDKVLVAGASMGGCIALQFAGSHPERCAGLGLIDTTAWYGDTAPRDWAARAQRARTEGLQALIEFQKSRWFSDDFLKQRPEVVDRCIEIFLRNDVDAFAATCHMLGQFDGRPLLPRIGVPTAVVVGEQDYAAPVAMAQALHEGIAGSSMTVLPDARHLTPLETPDVIANTLLGLLECRARDH